MPSHIQLIFSLAIIACVACMALAFPAEEPKVKNPRLGGGARLPSRLARRDAQQSVDIDLSSAAATIPASDSTSSSQAVSASVGTIATDEITTTGNHTWWTTEEALANNNGSTEYQFNNMPLAETNPLNDGQKMMEQQNKKAKKDAKKAKKAEKKAKKKKNETSTDDSSDNKKSD